MTGNPSKMQIRLAQIAVALIVCFAVAGVLWRGLSPAVLARFWANLVERPGGPMTFRFILQPTMAAVAAWRDAVSDARLGREPYLFAILRGDGRRSERMWEGIVATAKIMILGVVMDVVYQAIVLDEFYPDEAAVVAILLAFAPYALLRGPFARVARRWVAGPASAR
jgi:hypothetical protein